VSDTWRSKDYLGEMVCSGVGDLEFSIICNGAAYKDAGRWCFHGIYPESK